MRKIWSWMMISDNMGSIRSNDSSSRPPLSCKCKESSVQSVFYNNNPDVTALYVQKWDVMEEVPVERLCITLRLPMLHHAIRTHSVVAVNALKTNQS